MLRAVGFLFVCFLGFFRLTVLYLNACSQGAVHVSDIVCHEHV